MLKPYIKTIEGDMETPITLYLKWVGEEMGFLLESKEEGKGRFSILGKNPYKVIASHGKTVTVTDYKQNRKNSKEDKKVYKGSPLEYLQQALNEITIENRTELPFLGGAVGTVGYDIIRHVEKIPKINRQVHQVPELHQMLVREVLVYDHLYHKIHLCVIEEDSIEGEGRASKSHVSMEDTIKNTEDKNSDQLRDPQAIEASVLNIKEVKEHTYREDFESQVNKAKEYIKAGDIFQVVLSQRVTLKNKERVKALRVFRQLRQVNPSAYMFYINFGEYQVVGSSPEKLVELRQGKITNRPIAGTRPKSGDAIEDQRRGEELLADPKETAEHMMLVDLGRNDMGRVAKIGTVKVTKLKEVRQYPHIMHLISDVEGQRRKDKDMLEILMSFLPAGTLSGAPKIRAMEIIEELENIPRGIYGGSVGYFGFDGNMDTCIAIRTMVIRDCEIDLQAGAGIVADSKAALEYEETCNKLRGLLRALSPLDGKGGLIHDFISR